MKKYYFLSVLFAMVLGLCAACSDGGDEPVPDTDAKGGEQVEAPEKKWPDLDYDAMDIDFHRMDIEYYDSLGLYVLSFHDDNFRDPMMSVEFTEVDLSSVDEVMIEPAMPGNIAGVLSMYQKEYIRCNHNNVYDNGWGFWPHSMGYGNLLIEYKNPYEIKIKSLGYKGADTYLIVLQRGIGWGIVGYNSWDFMKPSYIIVHEWDSDREWRSNQVKKIFYDLVKEWESADHSC